MILKILIASSAKLTRIGVFARGQLLCISPNGLPENAIMWFNSMMKANPEKFQIMFLCPPRCIDPFPEIFVVSAIYINRQHCKTIRYFIR